MGNSVGTAPAKLLEFVPQICGRNISDILEEFLRAITIETASENASEIPAITSAKILVGISEGNLPRVFKGIPRGFVEEKILKNSLEQFLEKS